MERGASRVWRCFLVPVEVSYQFEYTAQTARGAGQERRKSHQESREKEREMFGFSGASPPLQAGRYNIPCC